MISEFLGIGWNIFGKFLWWKINYFRILEIIKIVRKFQKYGIISSLLIRAFLKNCWDMFGNFDVENLFYWIIGNVGIVAFICIMIV